MQQYVDMSTQLLAGLQYDSVQIPQVFQQEYVLVGGAWLYHSVNVANYVQLLKHQNYCLQSQNKGRKDRTPERHLIADDRDK